jgi:hypothetical protein
MLPDDRDTFPWWGLTVTVGLLLFIGAVGFVAVTVAQWLPR